MKCTLRIVIWQNWQKPRNVRPGFRPSEIWNRGRRRRYNEITLWPLTSSGDVLVLYIRYLPYIRRTEPGVLRISNTRHHCRNGHSLQRWYTHNRYTVKIHVGNVLKTITVVLIFIWSHHCHLRKSELGNITLNGPLCGHQHTWVKNGCTFNILYQQTVLPPPFKNVCSLEGGVGCKRLAFHGNWCTTTVCIKSIFIEIA